MCSCTCRYEGCSCTDERRRFRSGPPESSAARSKVSVSPKKIVFLPGESDPDRTIPRLRRHMKKIACVAPYRYNPVQCPLFVYFVMLCAPIKSGLKSKIWSQTELFNSTYVELEPKIVFNINYNPHFAPYIFVKRLDSYKGFREDKPTFRAFHLNDSRMIIGVENDDDDVNIYP
ncbi:hypothetical protein AGLY_006310 [Aphis glycines]|uniref:Uncharacterized protein n=1 Tax=Aphis glycines TaxID=307491 RepID=A0A6G0TQP9_APHGL|nr:hypothetical protein AGLY_006310 [Aphis glycines]